MITRNSPKIIWQPEIQAVLDRLETGGKRIWVKLPYDYLASNPKLINKLNSGREANVVNQATQNGNADDLCAFGSRLHSMWISSGYSLNPLMGSARVVVVHEFAQGARQMAFVEENKVIQAFGLKRLDDALAVGVCLGGAIGRGDASNAHRLKQPLVQVAPEGAARLVSGRPKLTKNPIVVMDQKLGFLLKGDGSLEAVLDEVQSGVVCDPKVNNLAGLQMHHHEDRKHFKVGHLLLEKVAAKNALGFLFQEGSPGAARGWSGRLDHVFAVGVKNSIRQYLFAENRRKARRPTIRKQHDNPKFIQSILAA